MSPLQGLTLVFTGKMSKTRDSMEEEAKLSGAWVENKVTGGTSYLVTGKRPGKVKLNAAKAEGCTTITEDQYRTMVAQRTAQAKAAEKKDDANQATTQARKPQQHAPKAPDKEWWSNIRGGSSRIDF